MKIIHAFDAHRKDVIQKSAKALKKGKVLVCPTDTVYGLAADATNKKAVRKIFLIKGREKGKPLPIFVKDIAMAKEVADIGQQQERFLRKVWPGKVTVVVKSKTSSKFKIYGVDRNTIALRIPKHQLVQKILQETERPLTGTSANVSGHPSLRDSKQVVKEFQRRKHHPDILLDAGKIPPSRPSKVVDMTGERAKVLRR